MKIALKDRLLVLRYSRLGRVPPGLNAAEILVEKGFPLLVFEYGALYEAETHVTHKPERWRLPCPWARFFPKKLRTPILFFNALFALTFQVAATGKPRALIAHGMQEQCLALWLNLLFAIPYTIQVHEVYESWEMTGMNRLFFALEGLALRKATFLIFPEKDRAAIYRERYALRNPIEIVFNCPRRRLPNRDPEFRRRSGLPEGAFLLLYIGGIGRTNPIVPVIKALVKFPRVHLLLVGWSDDDYRAEIESTAREVGIADRVHSFSVVPSKWPYLDNCDASYCVYSTERLRNRYQATASNKLTEAMSSGVPVLTSSSPDFKAVVEGYGIGLCVAPDSESAIAEALKRWLESPELHRSQSRNALRAHAAVFHFDLQFERVIERFDDWFPELRNHESLALIAGQRHS